MICQPQMRPKPQLQGKNGNRLWKPVPVLRAALSLATETPAAGIRAAWHLADKLSTAKGIFGSGLGASSSVLIISPHGDFCSPALDVHATCRAWRCHRPVPGLKNKATAAADWRGSRSKTEESYFLKLWAPSIPSLLCSIPGRIKSNSKNSGAKPLRLYGVV